jgi:hypothetical protein
MILKIGLKIPQVCEPSCPEISVSKGHSIFSGQEEGDPGADPEGLENLKELNKYTQLDFTPFDPLSKQSVGKLQGPDGSVFHISKVDQHQIFSPLSC